MNFLTASVGIKVDDSKLPAQLAKIKSVVTKTVDRIKTSFKKMATSFKAAFDKMVRVAKYGALAVAGALALMIRAAMKQEDVEKRLEITLKATGYAAGFTKTQLLEQASALQSVTRFGDETITAMQTMLLTFKNIKGDEFKRATEAALDMATAEAAVSGRAVDLTAASIRLGKALNDPILGITALSRVGVQFTEVQKEMIERLVKTGDVAGAQAIILRELESEFGGMARDVDTASGALRQMWNALGDAILEAIGKPFLEHIRTSAVAIKEWAERNQERIGEWAKEVVRYVGLAKNAFMDWVRYLQQDWKAGISMALDVALVLFKGFWQSSVVIMKAAGREAGRAFVSAFGKPIMKSADAWLEKGFLGRLADPVGSAWYAVVGDLAETIKEYNKKVGEETTREAEITWTKLKQVIKTTAADIKAIIEAVPKLESAVGVVTEEATKSIKEQYADALRAKIAMIDEEMARVKEASDLAKKLAEEDKQVIIAAAQDQVAFVRAQDYMTRQERIQNLEAYVKANQVALDSVLEANKILADELKKLERDKWEGVRRWMSEAGDMYLQLDRIAVRSLDSMADALTDMCLKGKADFKALAQSIIMDITRMMIKQAMFNALSAVGFGGGGGGISALFAGLFAGGAAGAGASLGSIAAPTSAASYAAIGAYSGGFQHGGTVPQTGFALVHKGETVIPAGNGNGGISVILNDNRTGGEPLEISEAEEYILSDRRIIEVTMQAAGTDGPYRRAHKGIR